MRISSSLVRAFLVLGCCYGSGAHSILAQSHSSPSELVQRLQSEQTTDDARDSLLKLGKTEPEVSQYLAVHLPLIIERGPSVTGCSGYPCQVWRNAVELAGKLKIAEASPALARWISVKDVNPWPGIRPYGNKLDMNPTAISLSLIGNPAIPSLQHVLESGSPEEHGLAVRAMCMIRTPKAKAVLREELPHEPDTDLQELIKREIGE